MMYILTVKLKNGDSIIVEDLQSINLTSTINYSTTTITKNDFPTLLPHITYDYNFIGKKDIFSILGTSIEYFIFSKQD